MEEKTKTKTKMGRKIMKYVNRLMTTNSPSNVYTKITVFWDGMLYRLIEIYQ
jgi:hypothetical protein